MRNFLIVVLFLIGSVSIYSQTRHTGISMGLNFSTFQFENLTSTPQSELLKSGISPGYFFSTHSRFSFWILDLSTEIQFSRIENTITHVQNGQTTTENLRINRIDIPAFLELNIGIVHFGGGIGGALNFTQTKPASLTDFERWNTYWLINAGVRLGPVSIYSRFEINDNSIIGYIGSGVQPIEYPLQTKLSLFRLGLQITF